MNLTDMKFEEALAHRNFYHKERGYIKVTAYNSGPVYITEDENGRKMTIGANSKIAQEMETIEETKQIELTKENLSIIISSLEFGIADYLRRAREFEEDNEEPWRIDFCRKCAKENRELIQRLWDEYESS